MSIQMPFRNSRESRSVLILSLIVSAFWFLAYLVDVYHFAVTGAIFELLWLPMIVMIFTLPVLSLFLWFKESFNLKSHYLHSMLVIALVALYMIARN